MREESIKKIISTDWYVDWSGPFPLLEVSKASDTYFDAMQEEFGKSIDHFLVLYKNGVASARLPSQDLRNLGEHLAGLAEDLEYVSKWADGFKKAADKLMRELRVEPSVFLKKLPALSGYYQDYGMYNVATKIVYNYLPPEASKAREVLEEARIYSERFYKVSADMFDGLAKYLEQQTGYPARLIVMMTRAELDKYLKTGQLPSLKVIRQRYKCSGVYFSKQDGVHILSALEVGKIEATWLVDEITDEMSGTVAYAGKVRGICRVVLDYKQPRLEKGEVLVTGMTDPDFVPLMKKASAIVTDGGGMLSHAAIIARELKTPCIIGTKIATQVLKDGDKVEVDADKGIVKILS
jgi:phosphohistidine swiveling domain-containing protein